jgi:hypothetical protein
MELTKKEKFMLFKALEFEIHRYLLANTYDRLDGNEKYERHKNISIILYEFLTCKKYNEIKNFPLMRNIHDYLAEILTDRMDEVIGFPIYERPYDYDDLTVKFFNVIVNNLDEIENELYNGEFSKDFWNRN